ncbi:hypothetical protein QYF36_004897 [Acer negundo]|nr:hypothetical protein QYF36_004897 [Acer negundo]
MISSDEELMIVFEDFDCRSKPVIEFDLNLFPLAAEILEDDVQLIPPMLESSGQPGIPNSAPAVNDEESDSDVDNDYVVNEESDEDEDADSDVSLDDDYGEVDDDMYDHCDPDGDNTWLLQSSDEETGVIKMAKYYRQYQWAPNPDGSIEISEWQILGNAKVTRDVLKRMTSNKEANARWVASVLQSTILADPKLTAKSLKRTLLKNYSVTCSSLTIYRAKKTVLNNLKTDHIAAYAKMKKYGNAIIAMNLGTCVKFGGVMLSANALDGDSDFLGWYDGNPTCFMRDRQKGELKALDNEWPYAGKRYCFRHMLGNFKSTFKDNKMNEKLWSIARAGSKAKFMKRMKSLREDLMEVVLWLMKEPCEKWARHAFDCNIKTEEAHQTGNGGSTNTTFQHSMTPLTSASHQYSTAFSARNQEGTSTASQQHMAAPTHVPDGCSQLVHFPNFEESLLLVSETRNATFLPFPHLHNIFFTLTQLAFELVELDDAISY